MERKDPLVLLFTSGRANVCLNLCQKINTGRSLEICKSIPGFKFADRDHPLPEQYKLGTLSYYWYGNPESELCLAVNGYCVKDGNVNREALIAILKSLWQLLKDNSLAGEDTTVAITDIGNFNEDSSLKTEMFANLPVNLILC